MKDRFTYDGESKLSLNGLQRQEKEKLETALNKELNFEFIECPVCQKKEFNILSEKDRYGIFQPVRICRSCGLIISNPRMTQESYKKFYQNHHKELYLGENRVKDDYFQNQVQRGKKIYDFISKSCEEDIDELKILEVGCSSGGILEAFKKRGNEVFGLDLIPKYVKYGKEKGLNLEVGTIEERELPWEPDIVIYSHTIEHILSPIDEMKAIKDKCGEDTLIYHETPGLLDLRHSYDGDLLKSLQSAHTYYFTLNTLTNIMNKSGFKLVKGNQEIKAVYKHSEQDGKIKNMYNKEMRYLKKMEYFRFIPTTYQIKKSILGVSQKLGMEREIKSIHQKLR